LSKVRGVSILTSSFVALGAIVVASAGAFAGTVRVPQDHASVQAGVLAASPGDTVLVAPGTYTELIRTRPGVVLKSSEGPDATTLVTPGLAEKLSDERLLECFEGDRTTVIEGFTMVAGDTPGAAVYVENASPTIRGNVITGFGWGIHLRFSKALVEANEIMNCDSFAILVFASSPDIFGNSIHDNDSQGISISGKESHPVIGGSPEKSNKIFGNHVGLLNGSRNDIDATFNDWGWETTAEMEAGEWPDDIHTIRDGYDFKQSHRGKGKVDYRNWIRPAPALEETSSAPGLRVAIPIVVALLLIGGFVGLARRRATSA
jgi:hypothetical protein